MSRMEDLHRTAMECADKAILARRQGDLEIATAEFRKAFQFESQAAALASRRPGFQPTKAVLHRSAASLALECGEVREAERLVCLALAGDPPPEIAEELRDTLEQATFYRHLSLRGIALHPAEVQMSLAGKAVGLGMAQTEHVITRVQSFTKLLYRTAERRLGRPYRERGEPGRDIRDNFEVFISQPRAASFACLIRVGARETQLAFDFHTSATEVIDDVLDGLSLIEEEREQEVRERIPDPAYYRNFVGLAKQLGPSGESIDLVGLTVERPGRLQQIALTRSRLSVSQSAVKLQQKGRRSERTVVVGELKYADDRPTQKGLIRIVDDTGQEHPVLVPKGMMADIVRPLFQQRVRVEGVKRRNFLVLEDIGPSQ